MGLYHGWDGDTDAHADFVRGGVSPDDFEEVKHVKKKQKDRPKKKRGCPENEFGPHVYVWQPLPYKYDFIDWEDAFYRREGFFRREYKICCGCGKTTNSRYTEQMEKLIAKKGWFHANYGD